MQMKEILHPGVIKLSVMCVVGGGVLRKHGTTLFIALPKCHYSQSFKARVVKQSLAWIADGWVWHGSLSVVQHRALIARKMYMAFNNQIY